MNKSIKEVLSKYSIINPGLLEDLNALFYISMKASRELGKRSASIAPIDKSKEESIWTDIRYACLNDFNSDYGMFAQLELNSLKNKYGLYIKNNGNNLQSTSINRKASSTGYSMRPFLKPDFTKKDSSLSVASINKFPLRKDVDG